MPFAREKDSLDRKAGLTLAELLVALVVLSIVTLGMAHTIDAYLRVYDEGEQQRDTFGQARFAMDRMVMFVENTDDIVIGGDKSNQVLIVSERVMDVYSNATQSYYPEGDGFLDADNDVDGLVNEGANDQREYIVFTNDAGVLREIGPEYGTLLNDDYALPRILCENVTYFAAQSMGDHMVELTLEVDDGRHSMELKTRAASRNIKIPLGLLFDGFDAVAYDNNNGTRPWSGNWMEFFESNGPTAGRIRVTLSSKAQSLMLTLSALPDGFGVRRGANLTGASTATLSYDWLRDSYSGVVKARASWDGGSNWADIFSHTTGNDVSLQSSTYDISAYISPAFVIEFIAQSPTGGTIYFDNVKIELE